MRSIPLRLVSLGALLLLTACDSAQDTGLDFDGDGYGAHEDCDDYDGAVYPDAEELCDGKDNDCDGFTDEDVQGFYFRDQDGDGYGTNTEGVMQGCEAPTGYVLNDEDCDDYDGAVNPAATEICDGVDNDCDGYADVGTTGTWYADEDGDGYGDDETELEDCEGPEGWVEQGGDCDDGDAAVNPGAEEVCDGDDDNCDGRADVGEVGTWYSDHDGDGYGYASEQEETCDPDEGWVQDDSDCNPNDGTVFPGAAETCNQVDDDCDDLVDEDFDADQDGWYAEACDGEELDCDDGDATVHPNAEEICDDGVDQDCDERDTSCAFEDEYDLANAQAKHWASPSYDAGRLVDVGDINADGRQDAVVATLYANGYNGGAYLIEGPLSGHSSMADAGHEIIGSTITYGAGRSVGTGDANGDGYEDIVVGAPWSANNAAWVVFGPITDDYDLASADAVLTGQASTYCAHGTDLADVNDDGVADAVIGAYYTNDGGQASGTVYVQYGPLSGNYTLTSDADATMAGQSARDYTGRAIRAGSDFDGDGVGDMLIPATYSSYGGGSSGAAYVVFGPVSGSSSLADADVFMVGESAGDYAGYALAMGDVNGDGLGDVAVGSYGNAGGSSAGAAHVVFGPGSGTMSLGNADLIVRGSMGSLAGTGVAIGDMDGDQYMELLVGAPGSSGGAIYLFYGPQTGTLATTDPPPPRGGGGDGGGPAPARAPGPPPPPPGGGGGRGRLLRPGRGYRRPGRRWLGRAAGRRAQREHRGQRGWGGLRSVFGVLSAVSPPYR